MARRHKVSAFNRCVGAYIRKHKKGGIRSRFKKAAKHCKRKH